MRKIITPATVVLCVAMLVVVTTPSRADVTAVGDFSPSPLGDAGGPTTGDLIIGDTSVGGFFMDAAPPLFGPLEPLVAPNVIVGNAEGSIGAMTLEDFLGGDVEATGDFTVGNAGQGFLDLFDSASVTVGGLLSIGSTESGIGEVTINGQGSRILTEDLVVGDMGMGNLELNNRASLRSTSGYIGNTDSAIGYVSVTGVGTRWSLGSDSPDVDGYLYIGNFDGDPEVGIADGDAQAGVGQGTLYIADRGIVNVADEVFIGRNGHLRLETQGRLRISPLSEDISEGPLTLVDAITNSGKITGDGYIDFAGVVNGPSNSTSDRPLTFLNAANGEIRNSGNANGPLGGTNQREKLVFTGNALNGDLLTNLGTIESIGGEMEFNVPVVNDFEIFARDAILRFPEGLVQGPTGFMVLGGATTVHGLINPTPLSQIFILNNSIVTLQSDLIFTEPFLVAALNDGDTGSSTAGLTLSIGDSPSALTVTGDVELSGATLKLDFSSNSAPKEGDIFEVMQITGDSNGFGKFANDSVLAGGGKWDIGYTANSVFVTYAGLSAGTPGDFNGDGTVDGRDFLAWQRNPGIGDLSEWQANYGQRGGLTGNLAAVPEPSGLILGLCAAMGLVACRKNRPQASRVV